MNLIMMGQSNLVYRRKQSKSMSILHNQSLQPSSLNLKLMNNNGDVLERRKSFQEFTQTSRSSCIRRKKSAQHRNLIVSCNSLVKPIHNRSQTETGSTKIIEKQETGRMSIQKTRIYHKSKKEHIKLKWYKLLNSQEKGYLIFCSKPIVRKKVLSQKIEEPNQCFQCRPWTRRGDREQNQQNLDISSKVFLLNNDSQY